MIWFVSMCLLLPHKHMGTNQVHQSHVMRLLLLHIRMCKSQQLFARAINIYIAMNFYAFSYFLTYTKCTINWKPNPVTPIVEFSTPTDYNTTMLSKQYHHLFFLSVFISCKTDKQPNQTTTCIDEATVEICIEDNCQQQLCKKKDTTCNLVQRSSYVKCPFKDFLNDELRRWVVRRYGLIEKKWYLHYWKLERPSLLFLSIVLH